MAQNSPSGEEQGGMPPRETFRRIPFADAERLALAAAVLAGIVFSIFLVFHAHSKNGGVDGFPLDDPWIHLTYARNLQEFHTFDYFPGERSGQGSTSPLYTFLLALGLAVTNHEKILCYVLGILFQACFLWTLGAWARRKLGGLPWAVVAVLIVGLEAKTAILSVSGMETSLFLFLVSLAFWAHARERRGWLSVALGLAVWVRPDALILALLFAGDALLDRMIPAATARNASSRAAGGPAQVVAPAGRANNSTPPVGASTAHTAPSASHTVPSAWWRAPAPGVLLVLLYVIFNYAVGGAFLPNTFAAKTAYYGSNSRLGFLRTDVMETFCTGSWLILLPFALGSILREIVALLRRRPGRMRVEAGWTVALPLAYLLLLPFGHRFDRYLVPALPTLAVLGLTGLKDIADRLARGLRRTSSTAARPGATARRDGLITGHDAAPFPWRTPAGIAAAVVLAAMVARPLFEFHRAAETYQIYCLYHWTRHERTGRWLAEHTPPDAVIATHDVGAIAYYSRRKVVDMVGVVLPEAVRHINNPDYYSYLAGLFQREKVTYLAVLRNWCAVDNVAPLFVADPHPEIMEVFPWTNGRTHLTSLTVSHYNDQAYAELRGGNPADALDLLQQALALDREDSLTWLLIGIAQQMQQHREDAETAYQKALALYPDYADAGYRYATLLKMEGRDAEARKQLQAVLQEKPDYPGAADLYKSVGDPQTLPGNPAHVPR